MFEVSERFLGAKGVAESPYSGPMRILGEEPWEYPGSGEKQPNGALSNNLKDADREKDRAFVDSIATGQFHNQAELGVESALSCMLGRMAAFKRHEVTWDELLRSNEKYDAKLDFGKL
jgi:hypothetical protein